MTMENDDYDDDDDDGWEPQEEEEQVGNGLLPIPPVMPSAVRYGTDLLEPLRDSSPSASSPPPSERRGGGRRRRRRGDDAQDATPLLLRRVAREQTRGSIVPLGHQGYYQPREDGTVRFVRQQPQDTAILDEPWGPAWQQTVFSAEDLMRQHPDYPFLVDLAGFLNYENVEEVFVPSGVHRVVQEAQKLETKVKEAVSGLPRLWRRYEQLRRVSDAFERSPQGGGRALAAAVREADATSRYARRGRSALGSRLAFINVHQTNPDGTPKPAFSDRFDAPRLVNTMRQLASDLLWLREIGGQAQSYPPASIVEWLMHRSSSGQVGRAQRREARDALSLLDTLILPTVAGLPVAEASAVVPPENYSAAFALAVIVGSWVRAVRGSAGARREEWFRVSRTNVVRVVPPDDPATTNKRRGPAMWVRQMFVLSGHSMINMPGPGNRLLLILHSLAESGGKEARRRGIAIMEESERLAIDDYRQIFASLRASMGRLRDFFISVSAPDWPRRQFERALSLMARDPIPGYRDFAGGEVEAAVGAAVADAVRWPDALRQEITDLQQRIDMSISEGIRPVAPPEIKTKVERFGSSSSSSSSSNETRRPVPLLPLLESSSTLQQQQQQPIGSTVRVTVDAPDVAAAQPQPQPPVRRHTASARWRLRPAFTGRMQLQPSLVASMGRALETVRRYLPKLLPRNVSRDDGMSKMTRTPGLRTLFAHLVESLVQRVQVRHQHQWQPIRMFDDMDINWVNAMVPLNSWVWASPEPYDTGVPGSACADGGDAAAGGGPPSAARDVGRRLTWSQGRRFLLGQDTAQGGHAGLERARGIVVSGDRPGFSAAADGGRPRKRARRPPPPLAEHEPVPTDVLRERWVQEVLGWHHDDVSDMVKKVVHRSVHADANKGS